MKRFVSLLTGLSVVIAVLGLAGCNTVAGFGRDLEKAGEAISGAANK